MKDRISGRVVHGTKPGPASYLSGKEEKDLAVFLKDCAAVGYGKTRRDVMNIAQGVAKEKGLLRGVRISQGWWCRFLERQNDLTLRRGDNTAHVRMAAVNQETLAQYFELLKDTLVEHNLLHSPSNIYNMDESGIPLDPKAPNVVAVKGTKKVRYRSSGRKGQVTIVACGNAAGQVIPPMVIFDAKNLNHAWTDNEIPGTKYGLSDKGWITTELFEGWLVEHFLQYAVSMRPLLLLLDGHSTHYQPSVVRYAKENQIIMLCLPPHTTHETQPLDCGVFAPLKSHWTSVCHDFIQQNPGKVITKFNFNSLFSKAWLHAVTPSNIISSFKSCGVYPLNPKAIQPVGGQETQVQEECSPTEAQLETSVPDNPSVSFTDEQIERFRRRLEEGYDLEDPEYSRWLELNHPEDPGLSISNHFLHVPPQNEVPIVHDVAPSSSKSTLPCQTSPLSTASTPRSDSSLSKFLSSPHLSSPDGESSGRKRSFLRACLLTSSDSLAEMEEKERKKQRELEEKERRRKEREEKRKSKEEELKKKAIERARKAEDKAKKKATDKGKRPLRKVTNTQPSNSDGASSSGLTLQPPPKRRCLQESEDIDTNECCVCFGCYEQDVAEGLGTEWISCACGRWLHVDCAETRVIDVNGCERFCPTCIM